MRGGGGEGGTYIGLSLDALVSSTPAPWKDGPRRDLNAVVRRLESTVEAVVLDAGFLIGLGGGIS